MVELNYFNQLKVLCYTERIEKILRGEIPLPVGVEIDPSNICNYDCPWCFYSKYRKNKNVMISSTNFTKIMDELVELDIKSVTFTGGGEPLVNPNTVRIIEEYGNKIDIGLVTNGSLLAVSYTHLTLPTN